MVSANHICLNDRVVLSCEGQEARSFLQGLVTCDLDQVIPGKLVYGALLTPQGKFLDDFFLFQPDPSQPELIWIDVAAERAKALGQKLVQYRLRAAVKIGLAQPRQYVTAYLDGNPEEGSPEDMVGLVLADPRMWGQETLNEDAENEGAEIQALGMGWRGYRPEPSELGLDLALYEHRRIQMGVPEAGLDLERERSTLFDNGFDRIGAIAWTKGCYVGQEITARMRYRGLAKWDLLPVTGAAESLEPGADVMLADKKVGHISSCSGNLAMARLRLEALSSHKSSIQTQLCVNGSSIRLLRS